MASMAESAKPAAAARVALLDSPADHLPGRISQQWRAFSSNFKFDQRWG
jgi:hypothetical protein